MKQIEEGLLDYHAQLKQNPPSAAQQQPQSISLLQAESNQHADVLPVPDYIKTKQPFAKVNQVAPMSPAYEVRPANYSSDTGLNSLFSQKYKLAT